MLSTQTKLVNKSRSETLNDSLIAAVAKDSGHLKKVHISFNRLKRTAAKKLMNCGDVFPNYVKGE